MRIFRKKSTVHMLRTLIIDDEEHQRQSIAKMLQASCPDVQLIGTADNVSTGIEAIGRLKPDLILLDIKLGDGSGFDILSQLSPVDFRVIFITAYDEYATKAFRFSALDYLLKPVDPDELKEAVGKAALSALSDFTEQLKQLRISLHPGSEAGRKIIIKTFDCIHLIPVQDILYCESDGNYTTLFLSGLPEIISSRALKEYEDMLTEYGFFRIHKSYLINLKSVIRFEKAEGGFVVLNNGSRIPVASRKRDILLNMFNHLR